MGKIKILQLVVFFNILNLYAQRGTIRSGIHWFDKENKEVSVHGAGIIKKEMLLFQQL